MPFDAGPLALPLAGRRCCDLWFCAEAPRCHRASVPLGMHAGWLYPIALGCIPRLLCRREAAARAWSRQGGKRHYCASRDALATAGCPCAHGVMLNSHSVVAFALRSMGRAQFGSTPLHLAASNGRAECARLLVLRGATTNTIDKVRQRPHFARITCLLRKRAKRAPLLSCRRLCRRAKRRWRWQSSSLTRES